MIGGTDLVISRRPEEVARRALVFALLAKWPEAVIEDARSEARATKLEYADPASLPEEILVYESEAWRETWAREGATERNADRMIHIILGENEISLVVDERAGCETAGIAEHVRAMLLELSPAIRDAFFEGLADPARCIEAA
jgi:hypothetical protein